MNQDVKCTNCGKDAQGSGSVSCWCDRDNCTGQRCSAHRLSDHFKCSHCNTEGTPKETMNYYHYHSK